MVKILMAASVLVVILVVTTITVQGSWKTDPVTNETVFTLSVSDENIVVHKGTVEITQSLQSVSLMVETYYFFHFRKNKDFIG